MIIAMLRNLFRTCGGPFAVRVDSIFTALTEENHGK